MSSQLTERRLAMVGMPETGKTTYVAAFWKAIQERRANTALSLRKIPESAAYLEQIGESWLAGQEVGHTPSDGGELIGIDLTFGENDFLLEVPDPSGESFEEMVLKRQIASELDDMVAACDGLLVFTHPDRLRPRVTIVEAIRMGAELPADSQRAQHDLLEARRKMPAEVETVELLQLVRRQRSLRWGAESIRIAIIVSAWDLVEREALPPAAWLEARMPMLHHYLDTTAEGDAWRVFGVSAQGGSYSIGDLSLVDPAARTVVVEPDGRRGSDLSLPILWATGAV